MSNVKNIIKKNPSYHHPFLVIAIIFCCILIPYNRLLEAVDFDGDQYYKEARFTEIVEHLGSKKYSSLPLEQKHLLLDSLARTAQGSNALPRITELLNKTPQNRNSLATAALVYASLGRFNKAKEYIRKTLEIDKGSFQALQTRIMVLLYEQKYRQAQALFEALSNLTPGWINSNIYFFTGLEVYTANRNAKGLHRIYKQMSGKYNVIDQERGKNLKKNARLFQKITKHTLFTIKTNGDKVEIPFSNPEAKGEKKEILLKIKKQSFRVILDTGNAVGLVIHSRILKDTLKIRQGGRALTRMGTESANLYGYKVLAKAIPFQSFTLEQSVGQYVPKPRPDFYDVNLNPLFIRQRIVSMDFINQRMVLSSRDRFYKDAVAHKGLKKIEFPWYGYEHALIPVKVNNLYGLAMIETGAEDIALKLSFAQLAQLPLNPQQRYLANGKAFVYHKTPVSVKIDFLEFNRSDAEVWPLNRFHNPIIGLTPDVIIGPRALDRNFIISFDPFGKKVIIQFKK